jgi:hypothetical protein
MPARPKAFYAYPSDPPDLTETIENAIKRLGETGKVDIASWRHLSITGRVIIDAIIEGIDNSPVFACDLTHLNSNVLFELGFAIGRRKRLWISRNTSLVSGPDYKRINRTLLTMGYAPSINATELVSAFLKDQASFDKPDGHINLSFGSSPEIPAKPALLYLKSCVETDASIALSEQIRRSYFFRSKIMDDPDEVPDQPLSWYVQNIEISDAVVAHLLSEQHKGAEYCNAKYAFVCGLARGLNRPILMLAHEPYHSPIDFQDLLQTHANVAQLENLFGAWSEAVAAKIEPRWKSTRSQAPAQRSLLPELRTLSVGEVVAENEEERIDDYFVETNPYLEALRGTQTLFVGRKGTGKTANLYAVASRLMQDKSNHVCIVKPVGYEVDGVIRMLRQSIPRSEKG